MAEGYRDVEIRDMASSWKSGLAFCAIIHRFRPDLIDYDSLSKENVFENNDLAFEVAEKELSIPAFLEAQDMVAIRVPDKLSVVTYVSQYYNYFHNKPQLGGPGVNEYKKGGKKKDIINTEQKTLTPTHLNTGKAQTQKDRQESMGDKCSICHEKVYLLERHIENAKLYHRSCYRRSELSPQTRLSKRQQERGAGEESKFRKLDGNKNESNNQPGSSSQDFWQRRAEAKAKNVSSQPSNQNSNSVTKVDDTPAWKKTDTSAKSGAKLTKDKTNDVVMQSPKSKVKFDKSGDPLKQDKQTDSSARPNKLADRFKALDERNLKSSQSDQNEGKSNNIRLKNGASGDFQLHTSGLDAKKKVSDKVEQNTPLAKPRQNILGKHEKMDTSESPAVVAAPHPRPVPRFKVKVPAATEKDKNSNETKKETPRSKTPTKISDISSKSSDLSSKSSNISSPVKAQGEGKPKTPPFKHKELSKPASPKQRPKSELTFMSTLHKKEDDMSQSSPPPLPSSVPPKLPASSPPHIKKTEQKSPTPSPRQPVKSLVNETKIRSHSPKQHDKLITDTSKGTKVDNVPPSKPPRISANLNETSKMRDITPMETDTFSPAKAVFHSPQPDQKAFISQPKRHNVNNDNKEGDVFGGLLKSLADVRTKHDADNRTVGNNVGNSDADKKYGASHSNVAKVNNSEKEKVELRQTDKKSRDENVVKFSNKTPQRPKSSFVSGRSEVFLHDIKIESHTDKNKTSENVNTPVNSKVGVKSKVTEKTVVTTKNVTDKNKINDKDNTPVDSKLGVKSKVTEKTVVTTKTTTTVVEDDTPAWKRQLDKRKAEGQRPKSVDVLSNNTENDKKPEWQKEAEKRMIARKGGYVDPEKVKVDETVKHPNKVADKNTNSIESTSRPLSPPQKKTVDVADRFVPALNGRASPMGKDRNEGKEEPKQKRKILPVAPESKDDSPPRQPEDKKKIIVGTKFVFDEIEDVSPIKPQRAVGQPKSPGPPRPPQPVVNKPGKKSHMSAYQIQRELEKIDNKLTDLELKGRGLEDSIRRAREEEEDDLMIDWFKLVSDKNELVRQEADIIYLSRQQELEAEQTLVEHQLRELVDRPDLDKSTEEQQEEEYLMKRLLDIVNMRSNIVDSIDEDRIRYLAEDKDIEQMLKDKGFSKDNKDGKLKKDKKKSKLL